MKIPQFRLILYPFLLSIYPILLLYQANRGEIPPADVFAPGLAALAGSLVVFCLSFVVFRNAYKAGLTTAMLVTFFFSFGYVRSKLLKLDLPIEVGRIRYLLPIYTVLGIGMLILIARSGKRLPITNKILNIIVVGLIAPALVTVGMDLAPRTAAAGGVEPIEVTHPTREKRDIYYLVFDRYAGERTLHEVFEYDNTAFLDYLRDKGFQVATESRANYINTVLSLTSSLNLRYLDDLRTEKGDDWAPTHRLLRNNRVQNFLRSHGYRYTHIGSWWEPTRVNPFADRNLAYNKLSEFSSVLLKTTAIGAVAGDKLDRRTEHRLIPKFEFDALSDPRTLNNNRPDFVFAHILLPHPPYVFDRAGRTVSVATERKRGRRASYVEQLMYTNDRIKQLVDKLLAVPEAKRPIIVLAADEGPYPDRWHEEAPDRFQKAAAPNKSPPELRMKFRILNTLYLPEGPSEQYHAAIGPVNTFRVILNEYFGTELALLPEKSYVFNDFDHRYDFEDVTDRVKDPPKRLNS